MKDYTHLYNKIVDRGNDVTKVIPVVQGFWDYDLYTRNPGPAYKNGEFVGTDLDLATFLYALADRKAVINIPRYRLRRAKTVTEGSVTVSEENRHGQILGLVANKEVFSFSVRIEDANILTTDLNTEVQEVGEPRTFMLVDVDGNWYDGWKTIEFVPSRKENNFLTHKELWTDNSLVFKNFIHPSRWPSFYGQYYLITKALAARLEEEASHYRKLIKDMNAKGVKLPEKTATTRPRSKTDHTQEESVKVVAFEVEMDLKNGFHGEYVVPAYDVENLKELKDKATAFKNIRANLQFAIRSVEFAYYRQLVKAGRECYPSWVETRWQPNYVQPGKRKKWDRLQLDENVVIRKRVYQKSERVAKA